MFNTLYIHACVKWHGLHGYYHYFSKNIVFNSLTHIEIKGLPDKVVNIIFYSQ